MHPKSVPVETSRSRKIPVVCHNCGKVFDGVAPIDALAEGWEGFSYNISVKMEDGEYRKEHIGGCPDCKAH